MDYAINAQSNRLVAGRYRMGRLLGSGGFGAVYLATDERLHRPVAIKICSTRRLTPDEAAEAADLFQREALTLARLRHVTLTAIWDYFNQDDNWYLVMEYVPGETLRDRIRRTSGALPLAEALEYAHQICQVLGYLHRQNPPIVFRDLKPANIMITPEGRVKLIDFGIARLFSPGKAADTIQFGTPGYAPPEQYGGQTEPRSDLYSLGVVLHQMLTGHNPASSPFRLPPASSLNPAVSAPIDQIINDATAYNIEQRISSAEEFCTLLERAQLAPALTQPLPQTTMIEAYRQPVEQQSYTACPTQPWTPQRRQLPERPKENPGSGLLVGFLLLLFLGTVATGGYVLNNRINAASYELPLTGTADPPTTAPPPDSTLNTPPSLMVFSAETAEGRNLYRAQIHHNQRSDRLEARNVQQITELDDGAEAVLPAISPDGKQIAFTKVSATADSTQTKSEVWLMDIDGSNLRQVLRNYAFAHAPAWHPDGTKLAAEIATSGNEMARHDIVVLDIAKNTDFLLVNTRDWEGGPAWSPNGEEIAYHAQVDNAPCMQLFKIDVNTKERRQLTNLAAYACGSGSGDQWPDWSENGQIAFGRRNLVEPGADETPTNRVVMWDPSQPQELRITVYRNEDYPFDYPRWSRSGEYLLFEEQRESGYGLAYMRPSQPNEQDQYLIVPLELNYQNIRYADWW